MLMFRSTHDAIVDAVHTNAQRQIADQEAELQALRAQLAERQVKAVRNPKSGRFEKRADGEAAKPIFAIRKGSAGDMTGSVLPGRFTDAEEAERSAEAVRRHGLWASVEQVA